jgi:hypothetical protein
MSYLYGDSTPSTLQINFIEFLRDALEFSVQVLTADARIREGGEHGVELRREADGEVSRLESLGSVISRGIDNATLGDGDSPTARCAEAILRSSTDLVRAEIDRVRSNLSLELGKLDQEAARERNGCLQALSALILRHDFPDWSIDMLLEQQGGSRYAARLHSSVPFGLDATLELEIPSAHVMAHVLRVDRLVERLEVQAPEAGGWLRKEVKLRPQRLEKEFVTELQIGASSTTIKLRSSPDGSGAGFDVSVRADPARVLLVRAGDADQTPFELSEADAVRVVELQEKLLAACAELVHSRKALVEAKLDGTKVAELGDPKVLVERLIATITPTVQEIGKRSLAPTELVLKRQLDGGRREEIFVSREELRQKLAPLTVAQRALFAPIGLAEGAPTAAPWRPAPSSLIAGLAANEFPPPPPLRNARRTPTPSSMTEITQDVADDQLVEATPPPVAKPK